MDLYALARTQKFTVSKKFVWGRLNLELVQSDINFQTGRALSSPLMSRNKSADNKGTQTLHKFFKKEAPDKKQSVHADLMSINTKLRVPKSTGQMPSIASDAASYLYPRNPEIREYQFLIARSCLFQNTLVCLPTGLGKTHIASVLILNYYRWFPTGKIYFLAPTRPLVYQQRNCLASYKDWISEDEVTEVNGEVPTSKRSKIYAEKRVFFMTPQTLDNDLTEERCETKDMVLVIFDQAHRAVGNYAYASIIQKLSRLQTCFRVVGLSATPGNCMEKIQEVITNLRISKIESKDDSDPDVRAYTHQKQVTPILIPANTLITESQKLLDSFIERPLTMLISMQVVPGYLVKVIHLSGINQGTYFQIFDGWRKTEQRHRERLDKREVGLVYSCLRIMKLIVDWKKALREQGYNTFRGYLMQFKDDKDQKYNKVPFKKDILMSPTFKKLEEMFDKEHISANHPKLLKLRDLLLRFFSDKDNASNQSKAIVFTGFKTSALEIKNFLDTVKEVRSALFVGQSKTVATTTEIVQNEESQQISLVESVSIVQLKQKDQIATIKRFRAYELNTLISTSIGEEGLDIGEVDLIICYDSGMSPIRLVQRMGRTGRKRHGKVYLLLMEGKEADKYEKATKRSQSLKQNIRENSVQAKATKKLTMYQEDSVMVKGCTQLPIEYIHNKLNIEKVVVKSEKKTKEPSKSKSRQKKQEQLQSQYESSVKSYSKKHQQEIKEDAKESSCQKMQESACKEESEQSLTKLSLNSDKMLQSLEELERSVQNFEPS